MVAVEVDEALLVGALALVVELLGDAFLDLGHHLGRVEALEAGRQHGPEQVGVAQVGRDRLADAGVLHLDRHGAFAAVVGIAPHGAVDLADRRCRDRLGIPLDEQLLGRRAELGLHHGRPPARRSSAGRWTAARRGPGAPARAVRRRGSSPSGRASSTRPSCCRAARRPARRCAAGARRRARRGVRCWRTPSARRSSRTSTRRRARGAPARRCAPSDGSARRGGTRRRRRPRRAKITTTAATAAASATRRQRAVTQSRRVVGSTGEHASGDHRVDGVHQGGHEHLGCAHRGVVAGGDREHAGARDQLGEEVLARRRDDPVVGGEHHRHRHVDVAQPVVGRGTCRAPVRPRAASASCAARPRRSPTAPSRCACAAGRAGP